jgi:hypothetical protein
LVVRRIEKKSGHEVSQIRENLVTYVNRSVEELEKLTEMNGKCEGEKLTKLQKLVAYWQWNESTKQKVEDSMTRLRELQMAMLFDITSAKL